MTDTQTIILLLILAANLRSRMLHFSLERAITELDHCTYELIYILLENIRDEALKTRSRISEVKTSLADEEKDDQRASRMERAKT